MATLPKLPDNLLTRDQLSRQNLADVLSLLQTLEALSIIAPDEPSQKALQSTAKLCLKPLMTATALFFDARTSLRVSALEPFDKLNPHVSALLKSYPFSAKLFAEDIVDRVHKQSLSQNKPADYILGRRFKSPFKRKRSTSSSEGHSKRPYQASSLMSNRPQQRQQNTYSTSSQQTTTSGPRRKDFRSQQTPAYQNQQTNRQIFRGRNRAARSGQDQSKPAFTKDRDNKKSNF